MRLHWMRIAGCLAAIGAIALAATATGGATGDRETRAELDRIVVEHVAYLLSDRFGPAWARIHPIDRRTVGRRLWEDCKRSSGNSFADVRYLGVEILGARSAKFTSQLHKRITAVAVTVEVQASLQGAPFGVKGVSYWVVADGRWARLVEQRKLEAYLAGRCPA